MFKRVYWSLLLLLVSFVCIANGSTSTQFGFYVPANDQAVLQNVGIVITAAFDSTEFWITDDGMDGDTDDSHNGVLMAGQSYVLYIKDNE